MLIFAVKRSLRNLGWAVYQRVQLTLKFAHYLDSFFGICSLVGWILFCLKIISHLLSLVLPLVERCDFLEFFYFFIFLRSSYRPHFLLATWISFTLIPNRAWTLDLNCLIIPSRLRKTIAFTRVAIYYYVWLGLNNPQFLFGERLRIPTDRQTFLTA